MNDNNNLLLEQEIREALTATEICLMSLSKAQEKLASASNWGIWDMLGGGLVATMFKHSRIDDAKDAIEESKRQLRKLKKELMDIDMPEDFKLEIGSILTVADYFFDGIIADWMVQSKIGKAKDQIDEAQRKVKEIRRRLNQLLIERGSHF